MGLFKKKSKGSSSMASPINSSLDSVNGMKTPASPDSADTAVTMSGSSSPTTPSTNKKKKKKNGWMSSRSPKLQTSSTVSTVESPGSSSPQGSPPSKDQGPSNCSPTMGMVPELIENLGAPDTSSEEVNSALRALFSLSEGENRHNREDLISTAEGKLVPALLSFLTRSERGSPGQYLALLVLNNVSIPVENKRAVAIGHGAARVLSRLLCADPSCHLVAIILVNLTFADADLRRELVAPGPIELVDALAYALRVAAASPLDSATHGPLSVGALTYAVRATDESDSSNYALLPVDSSGDFSPKALLIRALEESVAGSASEAANDGAHQISFDPKSQLFSETARWCLCALKNLTRPSRDTFAASAIVESGIVPLIFRAITVETPVNYQAGSDLSSFSEGLVNDPRAWDSNSLQDAALSTVLNMTMIPAARTYLRKENAIQILSVIADQINSNDNPSDAEGGEVRNLQCLKSRMALSFLIGGEGHYGQPKSSYRHPDESTILLMSSESSALLDLASNVLHQRGKEGPGGYSAATFTAKGIIYSIRCLLTSNMNQNTFAMAGGTGLNVLLLKAIAQHSLLQMQTVDVEAAEHACFSLYLLSSFGFKNPFLPDRLVRNRAIESVLTSYMNLESITPAGRHAAEQLLLRLPHLMLEDSAAMRDEPANSDFDFDDTMLEAALQVNLDQDPMQGARPMDMIFSRPILRSRNSKKNAESPWDNKATIKAYPSALHAVQDLSFGSKKVHHMDPIDDILIADNIANSANGEKTESYNFLWSWEDAAQEIHKNLERKPSAVKEIFKKVKPSFKSDPNNDDEPFSFFGFKCGAPKQVFACDQSD